MAIKARKEKQNNSRSNLQSPVLDSSNYPARLVQVIDLGLQSSSWKGEEKTNHEVMLTYELGTEFCLDENGNEVEDKPRWLSETINFIGVPEGMDAVDVYTDQYKSKGKMVQRAKALDPKGFLDFDFEAMLGNDCTLTVIQRIRKKDGETVNGIGGVTPAMKGMKCPDLVNPPKCFLIDEPDLEIFKSLPDWLQEKIKGNLEYSGSELQKLLEGKTTSKKKEPEAPSEEFDDDVPFDTDEEGEW